MAYNKTWIDSVSLLPETPFVFSVLFNDQELLFAMNYSKAEIFYRENESNLNHQLQNESKNQDTRTVFIVSHFADSFLLSAMCVGSSFQFLFSPLKPCKLIRNRP